jgi:hypothetical protein
MDEQGKEKSEKDFLTNLTMLCTDVALTVFCCRDQLGT